MKDAIIIIVVIILLNELNNHTIYDYFTTERIKSSVDNRSYKIVSAFEDKDEAADKMAQLNKFIIDFLRFLKKKFIIDRNGEELEIQFVTRVLSNYNPDSLYENNPKKGENTSFVINKGDKFALCLRNMNSKDIHHDNILQFVIIHELTHLGTRTYGHDYQFWSWMKFMLVQAQLSGLYEPFNYNIRPVKYCGMDITGNPYFDKHYYNWLSTKANGGRN